MNSTDQEQQSIDLLKQIAAGQQKALETFYQLYEPRVYRYALSRLNDSFEAADTLNEVMMEVWKYAQRFEGRSKVSTWLLGITHHKVYDRLRKRKKSNLEDDVDDFSNKLIDDNNMHMEQVIAGADDAKMIENCINKLSGPQREVIHLAFYEDMNYQDIAKISECPIGTVKTRIFHAKQALKKCLSRVMAAMESLT